MRDIRSASLRKAVKLGYQINPDLPLLDYQTPRKLDEICSRMLCLCAVLAVAYGFPRKSALAWLNAEKLGNGLTEGEQAFILKEAEPTPFQDQVDGMFALAWATSVVDRFEFDSVMPEDLVSRFPDLRKMEMSTQFSPQLRLQPINALLSAWDLSYCLHWAIRDAQLQGIRPSGRLHPVSVIERRRGLEWIFSAEDWDNVELDT